MKYDLHRETNKVCVWLHFFFYCAKYYVCVAEAESQKQLHRTMQLNRADNF